MDQANCLSPGDVYRIQEQNKKMVRFITTTFCKSADRTGSPSGFQFCARCLGPWEKHRPGCEVGIALGVIR